MPAEIFDQNSLAQGRLADADFRQIQPAEQLVNQQCAGGDLVFALIVQAAHGGAVLGAALEQFGDKAAEGVALDDAGGTVGVVTVEGGAHGGEIFDRSARAKGRDGLERAMASQIGVSSRS